MSDNWQDDLEFKKQIMEYAREDYERNKDNPYAATGYANVILALHGHKGTPIVPDALPTDDVPRWVKAIRHTMKATFGSGNGRR